VSSGQILALDLGRAKSGLARASSVARLPEPLKTVATEQLLPALKDIAKQGDVEAIVVGLPRGLSGQETEQTRWVRDWAKRLKTEMPGTSLYWQDEALTSQQAQAQGAQKADEDAVAASIILRDFLESDEKTRSEI